MDLALAYALRAELEAEGKSIGEMQFLSLIHSGSNAKEAMLEDETMTEFPIAVPSRGSSLFGGTVSTTLDRATLEQIVLDGFFATTAIEDLPQKTRRAGLQEFGLPYASDPVISKHLARFLTRSLENVELSEALRSLIGPEARQSDSRAHGRLVQRRRLQSRSDPQARSGFLTAWSDGAAVREFAGFEPDPQWPRGSRFTGESRHRQGAADQGRRVALLLHRSRNLDAGGAGLQTAVESALRRASGHGGGSEVLIEGRDFALVTGQPAEFRFFSSEIRSGDAPGQIIPEPTRACGNQPTRGRSRRGR